jgi:hypothetical protein
MLATMLVAVMPPVGTQHMAAPRSRVTGLCTGAPHVGKPKAAIDSLWKSLPKDGNNWKPLASATWKLRSYPRPTMLPTSAPCTYRSVKPSIAVAGFQRAITPVQLGCAAMIAPPFSWTHR